MDLHAFFWRVFGQCRGISFKLFKNSGKAAVSDGQEDAGTFTCTKAHQRSQSGFVTTVQKGLNIKRWRGCVMWCCVPEVITPLELHKLYW